MNFRAPIKHFIAIFGALSISLTTLAGPFAYQAETFKSPSASKNLSFEVLFKLYQKKCVHTKSPPHPCFLTEKDLNKKTGRPENVLLFRGEPSRNSLPATSSFYRWALNSPALCKENCTNSSLMSYLFDVAPKLSHQEPNKSLFFRYQDRSWLDDNGAIVNGNLAPGDTGLEVLAKTHKIGSGLYFEEQKNKMFDPMVSFSFDPLVADLFARLKDNNQGVLWIATVPRSAIHFMKGLECKTLIPKIGQVYDFNGCIDTALNELEIEVNAVMFLPSAYYYDRILNR